MEFGIFNLMGAREPDKPAAQVFREVADMTRRADELGYSIAWFAEHHFSNYCLCASPLMMVAHCAASTKKIRLGTAVVVVPLYNPARLAAEIATADGLSNGRLMLGIGAGYQPYEFERFGVDLKQNLEMTNEFCDILDLAFSRYGASYVVALTVEQNEASQGLMKRLRMTRREDMDFQSTDMPPELNPVIVYRIEAEEWPAARAAALS